MQIKCEYCGNLINDRAVKCPHCGAPNANMRRSAVSTPKTIAELEQWYEDRHLPPYETTRFFIGVDCKEPRAFGIYQSGGEFIVYKNKADGSRAERYRGSDEAYAVNELYLKLKSEILNQKARQGGGTYPTRGNVPSKAYASCSACSLWFCGALFGIMMPLATLVDAHGYEDRNLTVIILVLAAIFFLRKYFNKKAEREGKPVTGFWRKGILLYIVAMAITSTVLINLSQPKPRYYRYHDTTYSFYDGDYFVYVDDFEDYEPVPAGTLPADFTQHTADYEFDASNVKWVDDYEFTSSGYYREHLEEHHSSGGSSRDDDSGWDWDSGDDWDSGGTDWDSDW